MMSKLPRNDQGVTFYMDWARFYELKALGDSGKHEEALSGLEELLIRAERPEDKASVLLTIGSYLRNCGRSREARTAVQRAISMVGLNNEIFTWALFSDAYLDMDEANWKVALEKF